MTLHAAQASPDDIATKDRALAITTADGATLGAHEHPARDARGVVVILGAMATPSRFYARFAEHLSKRGLTTIRFDYRGVGASRAGALARERAGILDWTERDVEGVLASVRRRHAGLPLVLVGHSLGGQAFGIAPSAHTADAHVLVASQSGWVGHWPGVARVRMELTWRLLIPSLTRAYGYLPGWSGIGEDVPARVVREWARWCTTPGYVTGALPREALRYADVRGPVLAWSFSDDDYAPRGSIAELLSWLTSAHVEHRAVRAGDAGLPRIGHFGFFRERSAALWDETADWILARLASPA
ncbi:MAG: alpha/beta fold hydrolase [Myxococcota bacterium]|nr:alpha/beta fold hydrolase [Myxococcota bacterium]